MGIALGPITLPNVDRGESLSATTRNLLVGEEAAIDNRMESKAKMIGHSGNT
jgi:hypothetical protein